VEPGLKDSILAALRSNNLDTPTRLAMQMKLGKVDFLNLLAAAVGLLELPVEAVDMLEELCARAALGARLARRASGSMAKSTRTLALDAIASLERPLSPNRLAAKDDAGGASAVADLMKLLLPGPGRRGQTQGSK
jgi:hypothetical protein